MQLDWSSFTPWSAVLGGIIIGVAAAMFVVVNGRIAGISGIIGGLLRPARADFAWRAAFVAGLLAAPLLYGAFAGSPAILIEARYPVLIVAGFLVGIGTRYGAGCTSGHGVCGVSRLSPRSLVATSLFMVAGFATVLVARHIVGA